MESLTNVNQLLRRFSGKAEFRLGQYTGMRPTETHIAWLRQKMLTEYDALGESEKKLVNNFLEKYNWMQLFDLRLKKGIKRIRNKYYHIDADNDFVEKTDRILMGWQIPASWFQSLNAMFIILSLIYE